MSDRCTEPRGIRILHDPALNKGTAFTEEERDALGLRGLLPPRVFTQSAQVRRVLENFHRKTSDLERYIFLIALQDRNERLFYRTVLEHAAEMMPIVYTPTVGDACRQFAHIFRRTRGLYISAQDRGRVASLLANWPASDARVIVVTDGERILGLGDLGANGMGIPIGKLTLYTVCAGIDPAACLPVMLDTGTDNEELRRDPLYIGIDRPRVRGEEYDALVEEFVGSVQARFPRALIQFEDFANRNAFRLLEMYGDRVCSFNDDIQGTAAVALAGLRTAMRITGGALEEQRFLFAGAGSAALGIADLLVAALRAAGLGEKEARERCWFVDSAGLVVRGRERLSERKLPYAHEHPFVPDLAGAVRALRPAVLLGATGRRGLFTREVIEAMAAGVERPIIFALSNPTSKAECTAEEAYRWSGGRAIFASGSPFPPVEIDGRTLVPGQGNNAYIFPGVGLGVVATAARRVTEAMFLAAADALAAQVSAEELASGRVYPDLSRIRDVSAAVASSVARVAIEAGLAQERLEDTSPEAMRRLMYDPTY